ncbi:MAG: TIGR04283 family arsenosugar biosynthesis glycosyltransferase [Acidobacteria bacterium]|nr:TIGR04283 family arsenosugar biosynthesis glycosyltransferase [Acidobacteriota bacterium]
MIYLDSETQTPNLISVVIPVLNEESQIARMMAELTEMTQGDAFELIVADGGSSDRTVELTRSFESVKLISCQRANRGWQMNQGAAEAAGDVLLFLHADVKLPVTGLASIRQALENEKLVGGCFQLQFPADAQTSLRAVAWGINVRTRWFKTATGDQAIFVRRQVFQAIGGYELFPLMEDIALFNEMKRQGKVTVLNDRVEISPRRWLKFGVWRTVMLMYLLRFGYWLGIDPVTLKRFFLDVR